MYDPRLGEEPEHLPIPVNWHGDGPVKESEAKYIACWCGDDNCKYYPKEDWHG